MSKGIKNHSVSQLNLFLACQRKFEYLYVKNIEVEGDTTATDRGSAIHETIEWLLTSPHVPTTEQLVKKHRMLLRKKRPSEDEEYLTNADITFSRYHGFFARIKKLANGVEVDRLSTIGGVRVRGIADVLMNNVVIDWKTSSKQTATISEDYRRQITLYCALFGVEKGIIYNICIPAQEITVKTYVPTEKDFIMLESDLRELSEAYNSDHKYRATGLRKVHLCPYCQYEDICVPYQRRKKLFK